MTKRFALLLLPLLVVGCTCPFFGGRSGAPPKAILKAAEDRFAEAKFTKLLAWEGNRLYSYMNGAAEAYYARGFRKLATVDVAWKETEAKVELYRMDAAANAAALFSDFNDGKGKPLPAGLGSASWVARELEGIFHRGPYFCRLIIYGNDKEAHVLLRTLAAAIDQSIAP